MFKHGKREGYSKIRTAENNKFIEYGNVHFGDIEAALQRSLTIKNPIENIIMSRIQSKGKGFKILLPRDERKLKRVILKQALLISARIFEKA